MISRTPRPNSAGTSRKTAEPPIFDPAMIGAVAAAALALSTTAFAQQGQLGTAQEAKAMAFGFGLVHGMPIRNTGTTKVKNALRWVIMAAF